MLELFAQAAPIVVPTNEWVIALIVAVTPVLVAVLKWVAITFGSRLPSWLKPILAMALGALAAYLSGVVVDNPLLIPLIGMAVIGLREIVVALGTVAGIFPQK